MFSKSCEYAIKAMIYVAQKSKDKSRVGLKEIAMCTDAPESFVAKIMQELCRKRLVCSIKGPSGGFFLTEKELNVSISDIVRAIDGERIFTDCVLGLKECSEVNPCPVHNEYKEIKKKMIAMMENNTIGNFNEKLDAGLSFLRND